MQQGFLHSTVFLAITWALGGAMVLYASQRALRGGEGDSTPFDALRSAAHEIRKILTICVGLACALTLLLVLCGLPGAFGATAGVLVNAVVFSMAAVMALFIARQFIAPPWWRLNAWSTDVNQYYDGSIREILAWIWSDALNTLRELRLLDRAVVVLGAPALMFDIASAIGTQRTMYSMFVVLLILYVALEVALITANRIPRVLMSRMQELRHVARAIASGDLSARARFSDAGDYEELSELVADINTMARSLEAREAENQMLHHQLQQTLIFEQERSTRDPLTSLRNHRYFQDSLASELYRCSRTGSQVTIGIIDLDNFKQVNDTYGHQEGDAVLLRITEGLGINLRPYDLACRLGGEEFGVIFPETGPEEAKVVLDRLAYAIHGQGPKGTPATFSAGLATYPTHAQDQATLYQLADEAAYAAKARGKAQSVIYDSASVVAMDSVEHAQQKEHQALLSTAKTLVRTVDAKDSLDRNHSELVSQYAAAIAAALGYDEEFVSRVYLTGLLHDVGKIGIDESIVTKAGRLSANEYEQIKRHPELSFQIVSDAGMDDVAIYVRHHHEHWDGSGYPDGLVGQDIPVGSCIVLVAEAFEVMTSDRVYRRAMHPEQALADLENGAGTMFDPRVVQAIAMLVRSGAIQAGAVDPAIVAHVASSAVPLPSPLTPEPALRASYGDGAYSTAPHHDLGGPATNVAQPPPGAEYGIDPGDWHHDAA